jgi:DNA polymerase-3 subunit delta
VTVARSRAGDPGPFVVPSSAELAPVYLLHGEEDLLLEEAVQAMIDVAVPPDQRSFNLDVLQASDTDVRDVVARASAFPLMAERRVVVVRDVENYRKDDLALLAPYVEHPLESSLLLLTGAKVDLGRKPFPEILKAGHAHEFKAPREQALPLWITHRLRAKGMRIEEGAARLLASFAGKSMRELDQELQKLILYCGERAVITPEDVSAVAGVSKEYNIWEFQHALAIGDRTRSLTILTHMVEDGNGAPYFVVMLTTFFATVRQIHDLRRRGLTDQMIMAELQRSAYALRDSFEASKRFTPFHAERALALLLRVDEKTKSGADDLTSLQTMVVDLLEGNAVTP